jgi:hypothetical protein
MAITVIIARITDALQLRVYEKEVAIVVSIVSKSLENRFRMRPKPGVSENTIEKQIRRVSKRENLPVGVVSCQRIVARVTPVSKRLKRILDAR